jgi:membrane protein DedA with SNARE-associated domain
MQLLILVEHWIKAHPDSGFWLTFFIAFIESIIVIGGLIPGSLAISAIGILAGSGLLNIYSTFFAATFGAFIGDTSGFLIGRFFKQNLKNFFLFKRYPRTLQIGKIYFEQHGGKSVFLGRFIGPIRAIVPAVAGMMGMRIRDFIIINFSSALGWSGLFFIPGVLIGMGHSQFKNHLVEALLAFLLLTTPYLIIHYLPKIRLYLLKVFKPQIFNLLQTQYFGKITLMRPYYATLTELGYLLLMFFAWIPSAIYKRNILNLSNFFLPNFIKHHPQIAPLLEKILWLNHPFFLSLNIVLLIVVAFMCNEWFLLTSLGLIYLASLIFQAYSPFVLSISIQYLLLRRLNTQKANHIQLVNWLMVSFWNLGSIVLSGYEQHEWLPNLLIGLLMGQIAWLYTRLVLRKS